LTYIRKVPPAAHAYTNKEKEPHTLGPDQELVYIKRNQVFMIAYNKYLIVTKILDGDVSVEK